MATGTTATKAQRQPAASTIRPPSTGASAPAAAPAPAQVPTAAPRARPVKASDRMASDVGAISAAANAFQHAARQEDRERPRRRAEEAGGREDREPGQEHPPPPVVIPERAADQHQRAQRQQVGVDDPLCASRADIEGRLHLRQRDVDDGAYDEDQARPQHRGDQRAARVGALARAGRGPHGRGGGARWTSDVSTHRGPRSCWERPVLTTRPEGARRVAPFCAEQPLGAARTTSAVTSAGSGSPWSRAAPAPPRTTTTTRRSPRIDGCRIPTRSDLPSQASRHSRRSAGRCSNACHRRRTTTSRAAEPGCSAMGRPAAATAAATSRAPSPETWMPAGSPVRVVHKPAAMSARMTPAARTAVRHRRTI